MQVAAEEDGLIWASSCSFFFSENLRWWGKAKATTEAFPAPVPLPNATSEL